MNRATLPFGEKVGAYTVVRCIGQGGYGDIYMVCDSESQQVFAMKVEVYEKNHSSLQEELQYIYCLQGSPHFPRLISFGIEGKIRYLVLELLGSNLSSLRRAMPERKFGLGTVLVIAQEMLRCLRYCHLSGIIHNDIKPANFLVRPNSEDFVVLIDFGLSKNYLDPETGDPLPVRQFPGFVGTKKYASPNAHLGADLTTRDDLFSWFYSLLELSSDSLPWKDETEKEAIMNSKNNIKSQPMYLALPERIRNLYEIIESMDQLEEINYDAWIDEIDICLEEEGIERPAKFEWEDMPPFEVMRISALPFKLDANKYAVEPDFLGLATREDGSITVAIAEGAIIKKYHPISTCCRI